MPYYQCFKAADRTVYCSSTTFRSHAEAKVWMTACLEAFKIRAQDVRGTFERPAQPAEAVIWPT